MGAKKSKKKTIGIATLGCGGLLMIAALGVTLFFGYIVVVDPGGGISDDEAVPGVIGGGLCLVFDVVLVIVGIVLTVMGAKANKAAAELEAGGQPGSQPGGPPSSAGAPAAAAAPAKPKKPFPTHFVSGCLSILILLPALGGVPLGLYFFDRASSADRYAERARARELGGERRYGLGASYWERRADERRTYGYGGLACTAVGLLLTLGGIIGSVLLAKKNKAKALAMAADSGGPPAAGSQPGPQAPPMGGPPPGVPPAGGPPPGAPPMGGPPPGGGFAPS